MKDRKTVLIIVLVAVIVILAGALGWQSLSTGMARARELVYAQGAQDGKLLEQREILTSILQSGYYVIPVVDGDNQTQKVFLGILQPTESP